jgi:aminoglycoside/choline kinase family phosphotransferase/GTP:adenosylcobinamide-phosphate guanylyltransferase
MSARDEARVDFLAAAGWAAAERRRLAGDASFRRYERLDKTGETAVLMDAPPDLEDVRPFVRIARVLTDWRFSAPKILAVDEAMGFVLLEDLGDDLFTRALGGSGGDERELYEAAVDTLVAIQGHAPPGGLPRFDERRILDEVALLLDWTLPALTGISVRRAAVAAFRDAWLEVMPHLVGGRQTMALFDYHADNLIWLGARDGVARVGLLDFQDAVLGPAALDLVSLLEDARRDVPPRLAEAMIERYLKTSPDTGRTEFRAAYAAAGAQRNTRILGVFARLFLRDGKPGYLALLPRVWRLLERDLAHPALAPVRQWFEAEAPASLRRHAPDPARFRLPEAPTATAQDRPKTAMVLAAGLGTRLRAAAGRTPKPLVHVGGKALIDHALDTLAEAGVAKCVVNIHHEAARMQRHLDSRRAAGTGPAIVVSDETDALLDTGGGTAKALAELGREAFFVLNSDTVLRSDGTPALVRLAAAWDDTAMDVLLLIQPRGSATGLAGKGDYDRQSDGRLTRRRGGAPAGFAFTGVRLVHPRAFAATPSGAFSFLEILDRAEAAGRLFGLIHRGAWMHVGTPGGLQSAEAALAHAAPDRAAGG